MKTETDKKQDDAQNTSAARDCPDSAGSVVLRNAGWQESCDQCYFQEGRHYCLLHSIAVKNMDTLRCDDHKPLSSPNDKDRQPASK